MEKFPARSPEDSESSLSPEQEMGRRVFLALAIPATIGAVAWVAKNCKNEVYVEGITFEGLAKMGIRTESGKILYPGGEMPILDGRKATITLKDANIIFANGRDEVILKRTKSL